MDIDARIRRRRRRGNDEQLVVDSEALVPTAHVEEPTDRGPVLERLLDHLDPVFDGERPGNAYVWGPQGAGKSAVVTALFDHLRRTPRHDESVIHTSTRAADRGVPAFVRVDARAAASEFAFYNAILDGLVDEPVPEHGIGTDRLLERLRRRLAGPTEFVVLAIDHVDEPGTLSRERVLELLEPIERSSRWLCVGRHPPDANGWQSVADETVEVPAYQTQVLVDVLMERASAGLSRRALEHAHARSIATWADGNAHDALAALFVAVDAAAADGRDHVTETHVERGTTDVPKPSVSLGRVHALPVNRQAVLRELVGLDPPDRTSVTASANAVASAPRIDLSASTVKRFLYEMAEVGILERTENRGTTGQGRPPSRLDPRFPPTAFQRLYDLREG